MSSQNKNEGKPRLSLVLKDFSHAIEALARLRENNLKKYDRDNWSESIGTPDEPRFLEENLESIQRHVSSLWKGEELDTENCDHHATAIMCRVCFILEYYYRNKAQREIDLASLQIVEYGDEAKNRLTGEPIKKSIYDWSDIPEQYKWLAKDKDEMVFMYAEKPELGWETWSLCTSCTQTTDVPWKKSLEARPSVEPKKNIYDWSKMPPEFNWCAKDSDGSIYAYQDMPLKNNTRFYAVRGGCAEFINETNDVNWKDSLEARPT